MHRQDDVRRWLDIEEIRQLTAHYNFAFDNRDLDAYVACWTPDGYVERLGSYPRASGHESLRALARDFPVDGRHVSSDFIISVNGNAAVSKNYCIYMDMKQPCEISMVGTYHDRLVRTDEGWKFSERIFEPHTMRSSESDIAIGKSA